MKRVLFPGTFDPFTIGHCSIVDKLILLFDEVIICVLDNSSKNSIHSINDRVEIIKESFSTLTSSLQLEKVKIIKGTSLVQSVYDTDSTCVARGLRNTIDFENEKMLALMLEKECDIKTIHIMLSPEKSYISSSFVKEMIQLGISVDEYIGSATNYYCKS